MPTAKVRGVNMNYKSLGDRGPWVALSPGGKYVTFLRGMKIFEHGQVIGKPRGEYLHRPT